MKSPEEIREYLKYQIDLFQKDFDDFGFETDLHWMTAYRQVLEFVEGEE